MNTRSKIGEDRDFYNVVLKQRCHGDAMDNEERKLRSG